MSVEENLRLEEETINAYNNHDLDMYETYWADREAGLARHFPQLGNFDEGKLSRLCSNSTMMGSSEK